MPVRVRSMLAWCALVVVGAGVAHAQQVQTTINDFHIPGTQPNTLVAPMQDPLNCTLCHADFGQDTAPYDRWVHSMMGQSGRDPVFYAALEVANNDVAHVGDLCLRCHTPIGWLDGRSTPTDGSALNATDRSGVSCIVCHRAVDFDYKPGISPPEDQAILAALTDPVVNPHSGSLVVDPQDRRRGPLDLGPDFFVHQWLESPYHKSSTLCANCHDVSNPAYSREMDGSYALNDLDTAAPSDDKYDQFPVERTYSEWLMSDFALGPVNVDGRFGGTLPGVSTCQDCHMPQEAGQVCSFGPGRPNVRRHDFAGSNTWVLRAVDQLYPEAETRLTLSGIEASIQRNIDMLRAAGDLTVTQDGSTLTVRVTNRTGHKLPTGYAEGRRMWVNVAYFDDQGALLDEFGAYDQSTATLDTASTKVYEAKMGTSPDIAAATGKGPGETFHFALNNLWVKDNRIPPQGFTNANFEAIQAPPVGYTYADGQYWDDTDFAIPAGTETIRVRVNYQTTSREYIEFLRDHGGDPGQTAYDMWLDPQVGNKSEPVVMLEETLGVFKACLADFDGNGQVDLTDFGAFGTEFGRGLPGGGAPCTVADPCLADFDGNGQVDLTDFGVFGGEFGRGLPGGGPGCDP